ncbi:cytochrome c family protein [uncultured Litoreibacter sp.]|uniref:c-type cytochrome n=1 Tax=uncultured Litoreibacter sp. TaxID=1392394 RepID=UPI0026092EFC|nr:cytochrome c family protein [uncultured Litoreibacter sp.]
MFDTMTMTKVLGAVCGSLLVFLLGSWVADTIYHTGEAGHGGEDHAQGYVVEVATADTGTEEVVEEIDFASLMAEANAEKGAKVFSKCKACHKVEEGKHGTGPSLFGIVDKDIAAADGYGYSDVLIGMDGTWTVDALSGFIENPKAYAPGTKMGFKGISKPTDRANLIAYLETLGG